MSNNELENSDTKVKCCCCCIKRRNRKSKSKHTVDENKYDSENSVDPNNRLVQRSPYCSGDLIGGLTAGQCICIKGFVLRNCLRFAVDLLCRKEDSRDIAFHFNPRLEERYVVRNCYTNECWGEEETTATRKFPFERNKTFFMDIFVTKEHFLVSVNDKHFCAFAFRISPERINGIEFRGMVDVIEVVYKEMYIYPIDRAVTVQIPIVTGVDMNKTTSQNLDIPWTGSLPLELTEGWQLEIYGRVKILPHSFYINLQEGTHVWPHPIVPLHLNPRFSTALGENYFVRNAWIREWGKEESAPVFPFSPGAPFKIAIRNEGGHWGIWVDNKLNAEFPFREKVGNIDTVYIQGDVLLKRVILRKTTTYLSYYECTCDVDSVSASEDELLTYHPFNVPKSAVSVTDKSNNSPSRQAQDTLGKEELNKFQHDH